MVSAGILINEESDAIDLIVYSTSQKLYIYTYTHTLAVFTMGNVINMAQIYSLILSVPQTMVHMVILPSNFSCW